MLVIPLEKCTFAAKIIYIMSKCKMKNSALSKTCFIQLLLMLCICIAILLFLPNILILICSILPLAILFIWMCLLVSDLYKCKKWKLIMMLLLGNVIVVVSTAKLVVNFFEATEADSKVKHSIYNKNTAEEFGILIDNYTQIYTPTVDDIDVTWDMFAVYDAKYKDFGDKSTVLVYPKINIILETHNSYVEKLFGWYYENYSITEGSQPHLTSCMDDFDDIESYSMGIESSAEDQFHLLDTIVLHICEYNDTVPFDSLVFVRNNEHIEPQIKDFSHETELQRDRPLLERLKDKLYINKCTP